MINKNDDNIYILSLEGAEIYEYMNRDREFKKNYVGMLPNSLNLDKLKEEGLKIFESKRYNKSMTNDIINVRFNSKVKSAAERIESLKEKSAVENKSQIEAIINKVGAKVTSKSQITQITQIRKLRNLIQYELTERNEKEVENIISDLTNDNMQKDLDNLKVKIESKKRIESSIKKLEKKIKEYDSLSVESVREELYKDGFTIKFIDRKVNKTTGEITEKSEEIQYVVFKRTAAKSRTSQVLFIKEDLHNKMIRWARLGMNLKGATDVDYPSLLGYESLVDSSIEDRIKIDPNNILLVKDVKSVFKVDVKLVQKNDKELLESVNYPNFKMKNDIFDGEGCIDVAILPDKYKKQGMILTRQHMWKSCLFNTNIQQFLMDYATDNDIDFDTWELEDMFKNKIMAKDVLVISTPNSLKALKFSKKKKGNKSMYKHWRTKVKADNNIFGICKSEKESKRGADEQGNIINQTSYQMLNSIPFNLEDMKELSEFEVDYIKKLKNDNDAYIEFLKNKADKMNSNSMWVELYNVNPAIVGVELFKEKRKKDINRYVEHCKKGKIRLSGDYCTIIQNGKELLYHAVGALPVKKDILDYKKWESEMVLKENEVYTTLHSFDKEYVAFRNPHTSPSNVLIVNNKKVDFIEKYFNLTDNIIYTNAINFEINRILSGQDVDSDSLILFDNDKMLEGAKKCYKHYKVCENGVGKTKNEYSVTNTDMAKIDNILAKSQQQIGEVVNIGMKYMSKYWDAIAKGEEDQDKLDKLLEAVDVATVLSEISIDSAKRLFDVDIAKQIRNLNKNLPDNTVPKFFENVSKNENIEDRAKLHNVAVDYLYEILDSIPKAEQTIKTIDIRTLLVENNENKSKAKAIKVRKKQLEKIIDTIEGMNKEIAGIIGKYKSRYKNENKEDVKEEEYAAKDKCINKHMQKVKTYTIKKENMYALISRIFAADDDKMKLKCKYKVDFLNTLYNVNREAFLAVFKEAEDKENKELDKNVA